jgi:hypothetical protein
MRVTTKSGHLEVVDCRSLRRTRFRGNCDLVGRLMDLLVLELGVYVTMKSHSLYWLRSLGRIGSSEALHLFRSWITVLHIR